MKRTFTLLATLVLALAVTAPLAGAKLAKTPIMKTATGSAQQVSATHIFTHRVTFHSKVGNAATVFVGGSTVSATNFLASLSPGGAYTITPSEFYAYQNQVFDLYDFYVLGTASDLVSVSYETIATP